MPQAAGGDDALLADVVRVGLQEDTSGQTALSTLLQLALAVNRLQSTVNSKARSQPELLASALSVCKRLVRGVEAAALFSANEDAEDVSTGDLPYLLAPFCLAELLSEDSAADYTGKLDRLSALREAGRLYSAFLQRCKQYGALGQHAAKFYQQEEEELTPDPNRQRSNLIERRKAEKSLTEQLNMANERRKRAAPSTEDSQQVVVTGGMAGWDEDDERSFWFTTLELAALKALQQRSRNRQEEQLLAARAQAQGQQGRGGGGGGPPGQAYEGVEQDEERRQEMLEQLRRIAVDLGATGNKRQELRDQVFRQGHLPPTRTLAEQAAIEMEEARQREEAQRKAEATRAARAAELGDNEDEEELKRIRAQDDYRDSNPRGWGNSKLKPCG